MLELEMLIQREIVSQKKKGKKMKAEGTLTFFFTCRSNTLLHKIDNFKMPSEIFPVYQFRISALIICAFSETYPVWS